MDWTPYLRKDGFLNTHKFKELEQEPEFIFLKRKYFWCKSVGELYYCVRNNITEQPKCYCGTEANYQKGSCRYSIFCSNYCAQTCKEIKNKKIITNTTNRGTEYPLQCQKTYNKLKDTCLRKYGHTSPMKNNNVLAKFKQTSISKYGVVNPTQAHISKDTLNKLNDPNWLKHQHHTLNHPIIKIAQDLRISNTTIKNYLRKHKIKILHFERSEGEKELYNFIKPLVTYDIKANDRNILNYYELDIYIPELKLAFEYDGEFWHRNLRERDRWKTFRCKELGIILYHIHERFWLNDQERMKQIISNIINKRLTVIFK